MTDRTATLTFSDGSPAVSFPVLSGSVGPDVIDIRTLYGKTGKFTYDPGFYRALLDSFYDEWLAAFDMCPVLTIRTDDLDFVDKHVHLETVVHRIQDKLAGKEIAI